jgi:hypothetical protein
VTILEYVQNVLKWKPLYSFDKIFTKDSVQRITFRTLYAALRVIKPKEILVINKQCRSEICPEIFVDVSHQLTAQLMHVTEQTLEAWCSGITARKHADASTEECNE